MPTVNSAQQTKITTLQTSIAAVKSNILSCISAADDVRATAAALGTPEAAKAANAAMRFKGILQEALGRVVQGHADVSDGLIAYDPTYGAVVVQGGGGGR